MTTTMTRVPAEALLSFTTMVIEAFGTPSESARLVGDHLVEANLAGHDSHGVMRLPQYEEHACKGVVKPTAQPSVLRESQAMAVVDGQHAWGPVVGHFAMDLALQKTRRQMMAAISVRHAHHVGRVGPYVAKAADQGYVAMVFCNGTGAARVAPWGGTGIRLSTNPIAIGVPTDDDPIVVDFATTAVAEGKVRLAKINGTEVPLGWVVDTEGNYSRDPNVAYECGALAPLGADQGHKGYCLAAATDILAGLLSGGGCGLMVPHIGNNLLIQVMDPDAFGSAQEFREQLAAYRRYLKSARRRSGVEEILLPGELEAQRREKNLRYGITIASGVCGQLQQLGQKVGIPFPG